MNQRFIVLGLVAVTLFLTGCTDETYSPPSDSGDSSCSGDWVGVSYGAGSCASNELLQVKHDSSGNKCDSRCVSNSGGGGGSAHMR